MAQARLHVLMTFATESDAALRETTTGVINGLYLSKEAFPAPPVDQATLQAGLTDFGTAIAATAQGGPHATANKNKKRHALISMLRLLAMYVQVNCKDDLPTLLSSGFLAKAPSRPQSQLPKPQILSVDHGNAGQLIVKVKAIRNAKSYEVKYAPVGTGGVLGEVKSVTGLTNSRSMAINGLTPRTTYSVQVGAKGANGSSDWSDPVSHISI